MEKIKDRYQSVIDSSECLYNKAQVDVALDEMAERITTVIAKDNPVILQYSTFYRTNATLFKGNAQGRKPSDRPIYPSPTTVKKHSHQPPERHMS